ncbi:MAG: alpha/beta hydrolase, partial [Oscillospiraceae bacterium]|nr:alpha/beta hydrolase [Oscillospiraceae bacterium]
VYPEVKGIISVSGFNQSLDMLEAEGRNIAGDAIDFVIPYLKKHEEKTFNEYAYMNGLQSLTLTDAPVMIVHSADDEVVPIEISYDRYYEKFKDNERFTFIRYEDRGHNLILCSDEAIAYREEYNKKGDEWLESIGGSENLTPEMRAEYIETNFDMHKGNELDSELMEEMLKFYDECVKK